LDDFDRYGEGTGDKPDPDEEPTEAEPDPDEEPTEDEVGRKEDPMYGKVFIEEVRSSTGFDSVAHKFIVDDKYHLYVAQSGIFGGKEFRNDIDHNGVFAVEDIPSGANIGTVMGDKISSYKEFMKMASTDYYYLFFNERLGHAILEYKCVKCPGYRYSKMADAKRGATIATNAELIRFFKPESSRDCTRVERGCRK